MEMIGSMSAVFLAGLLLFAATAKWRSRSQTARGFQELAISPRLVVPTIVAEALVALLLVWRPRLGGLCAAGLFAVFTYVLVAALANGPSLKHQDDVASHLASDGLQRGKETFGTAAVGSVVRCSCFGASSTIVTRTTIVRNIALLVLAGIASRASTLHLTLLSGAVLVLLVGALQVVRQLHVVRSEMGSLLPKVGEQ
jgi:hypothetical protein